MRWHVDCEAARQVKGRVVITRKDIQRGQKNSEDHCPIALAAQRLCGEPVRVFLFKMPGGDLQAVLNTNKHPGVISMGTTDGYHWQPMVAHLPAKALESLQAFDRGEDIKPFWFHMELQPGRTLFKGHVPR